MDFEDEQMKTALPTLPLRERRAATGRQGPPIAHAVGGSLGWPSLSPKKNFQVAL